MPPVRTPVTLVPAFTHAAGTHTGNPGPLTCGAADASTVAHSFNPGANDDDDVDDDDETFRTSPAAQGESQTMQTLLVKSRNFGEDNCLQRYKNLCSRTCGLDSEPPLSHGARDAVSSCEAILFLEPTMNVRSVQHCVSRRRETNTNTDYY